VFCSLRCRIRAELYEFLIRFPRIIVVMDEIDMYVSQLLLYFSSICFSARDNRLN
jgi:hypothetical protein